MAMLLRTSNSGQALKAGFNEITGATLPTILLESKALAGTPQQRDSFEQGYSLMYL